MPDDTTAPVTHDELSRWRTMAAAAARTGAPIGKALQVACEEIERLQRESRGSDDA